MEWLLSALAALMYRVCVLGPEGFRMVLSVLVCLASLNQDHRSVRDYKTKEAEQFLTPTLQNV